MCCVQVVTGNISIQKSSILIKECLQIMIYVSPCKKEFVQYFKNNLLQVVICVVLEPSS